MTAGTNVAVTGFNWVSRLGKSFTFLIVCESDSSSSWPRIGGVGNRNTRLVILHSDWSSCCKDSSVAIHCSFLHSLSHLVNDLWRRLTSAVSARSLFKLDLQELGRGCGLDWSGWGKGRVAWTCKWVINPRVPGNAGNFLNSPGTVSYSGRNLQHGVSNYTCIYIYIYSPVSEFICILLHFPTNFNATLTNWCLHNNHCSSKH
jgi:hypothetical protein